MRFPEWWTWPVVQWWWYRQYRRADRRAFARECAEIRWRYVWTGNPYPPGPVREGTESLQRSGAAR